MSRWTFGVALGIFLAVASLLRHWLRRSRQCPCPTLMTGKTVIITGANSGLGKAAATELARRKARVLLACRSLLSAEKTAKEIKTLTGNSEIFPYEMELGSFKSIRQCAKSILENESKIDVLVNNAGVYAGPYTKTEEGLEVQMGVNHFGHFLFTSLLIEKIKQSAPSRIVIVSSSLSKRGKINFDDINYETTYKENKGYSDSKLANLLFARKLSEKLSGSGVDVLALHPGLVATNLGRHIVSKYTQLLLAPVMVGLGIRDMNEGCQPIVYSCVSEDLTGRSGQYVGRCCQEEPYPPNALDDDVAQRLWELSERVTQTTF